MIRPAKPTTLLSLSTVLLICTMAITGCLVNSAKVDSEDWVRAKKAGIVSCSPAGAQGTESTPYQATTSKEGNQEHPSSNDSGPTGKNGGNGCAHQSVAGTLCDTSGPRRRVLKEHSC